LKSKRGMTLVELVISLAALLTVSALILPGFSRQIQSLHDLSGGGVCEGHLASAFAKIQQQKIDPANARDFLSPDFPAANQAPQPALRVPTILHDRFNRLNLTTSADKVLYKNRPGKTLESVNFANDGIELYTPLLANNFMGYLGDLYSKDFKDGFRALPAELRPDFSKDVLEFSGEIKLDLYRLEDGELQPSLSRFWPRPKNQFEQPTIFQPVSQKRIVVAEFPSFIKDDLGFRVTVRGVVRDKFGRVVSTCVASRPYSYPFDFHAAMSFVEDFNVVRFKGSSQEITDRTSQLSNKGSISKNFDQTTWNWLEPIFTNLAVNPNDGRDRELCSQKGTDFSFEARLRVLNYAREPGMIPMCLDNSYQWLKSEISKGGWCPQTNITGQSHLRINYSQSEVRDGWVPCEYLRFCNQAPNQVTVTKGTSGSGVPFTEYRYRYDVKADDNASLNRLWGCELSYKMAAIDTAGNLIYPPGAKPAIGSDWLGGDDKVNLAQIRSVNPKIYLKPPPCYTCDCKPCKKGKGGFLGSLFKILIFIVLVVITGGAYAAAYFVTSMVFGFASVACLLGGIGCEQDKYASASPLSSAGKYRSCDDRNWNCKCGHRCTKRRPPGPRWADTLSGDGDDDQLLNNLVDKRCQPAERPLDLDGVRFTAKLQYKSYDGVDMSQEPVEHFDEVLWQEFMPTPGKYCVAHFRCENKEWKPMKESFIDPNTGAQSIGNLSGCFDVKVAYDIQWGTGPNKPQRGKPSCLEVNFNRGPFNDSGEGLKGYNDLDYECFRDTKDQNITPAYRTSDGDMRVVGKVKNSCPVETQVNGQVIRLAAPLAQWTTINNGDSQETYFECWKRCDPPAFMPEGPLTLDQIGQMTKQKYYEAYSASYSEMRFCTLNKEDFDNKK
jgi:hypothetical protein